MTDQHQVVKDFPKLKFQGKGHEFEDLKATILGASLHSCYTEVGLGWFRQVIPIALIPLDTFAGSHGRIQEVAEGVVSIQGSFLTPCSLFPHTVDIDQYDLDRISQYSMGSLSCGK